ncbi:MAG: hypothetical protein Q9226_008821 [Calogaya cf. arnoldii]
MWRAASNEDEYELAPLLDRDDDDVSIKSSEPDAPLGSDDGDVEPSGLSLVFLLALFAKRWFWLRLVLLASSLHVSRPGPWIYYDLFPGALASGFLLLECIEIPLTRLQSRFGGGGERTAMNGLFYWGALGVLNLVSAGAWYLASSMDVFIIFILGSLTAFTCVPERYIEFEDRFPPVSFFTSEDPSTSKASWLHRFGSKLGYYYGLVQILHLFLMFVFFVGGMDAWTSDFNESGLPYKVQFDDGTTRIIHVLCKTAKGSAKPTVWFEAGQDRGTWWTFPLQSVLLDTYNRSSCSYDNPSYGRSDPASVQFTNSSSYWPNLLEQLGKKDEPILGIGWGSGTDDILAHAVQTPSLFKGIVVMHTYPVGIEWMESAQQNDWTDAQVTEERQKVLTAQIRHERQRMTFGVSWMCANLYTYYDYDYEKGVEYSKDMQLRSRMLLTKKFYKNAGIFTYYSLIKRRAQPVPNSMPKPDFSESIPVFGIIHNNTRPRDSASNAFRREQQELMVSSIAGGREKVKSMAWCSADNCTDPLPLYNQDWLAGTIVGFGI